MIRGTRTARSLCSLLLVALTAGCAAKPPLLGPDRIVSDNPEVEQQFREARDRFDQGDLDQADAAFTRLAKEHPDDPLARAAAIYRARIALARNDPSGARRLLKPVAGKADPIAERAAFYDGIALFRLGEYAIAVKRLRPFEGRMTDPVENLLLLETLWKAANFSGDRVNAILWLDQYLGRVEPGEDQDIAVKSLEALAAQIGDVKQLESLAAALDPEQRAWPLVMARMAALYFDAEAFDRVRQILDEASKHGGGQNPAIREIGFRLEQREAVDLTAVGLIVPLSGRSRLVGESVVRGAMLGAKTAMPDRARKGITVVIRDSGSDPEAAARAVEDLVYVDHVAAIVGPLDAGEAASAAARAQALGVPLLALSLNPGLTETGAFVFRHFATNESEIRALVDASESLGSGSYFALYPDTGYGRAMAGLLKNAVEDRGMVYAGEQAFAPDETAFVEAARALADTTFDALFIPANATHLALIAPALAAAGLWPTAEGEPPGGPGRPVQLLVTSTGFSPDLLRRAGRYLDGALLTTYFHKGASRSAGDFADRFRAEYSADPNYLAGFGYDGVTLVAGAIRDGASSRRAIRDWLAGPASKAALPLATPFAGFSKDREPLALPIVLRIDGGEFSPWP